MTLVNKSSWLNILYSIVSLLVCLGCGYIIFYLVGGLPPSLYGMAVLTIALQMKWLNADKLNEFIAWGIRHMGVCFVPAGVGIIEHGDLIKHHGLAIVAITFITTLLIMSFVGIAYQKYEQMHEKKSVVHAPDKELL